MADSNKKYFLPRVNQLDAIYLNKDINRLIQENLLGNLQAISPILFSKIQPELDLLVQSAIWLGSVGKHCSSFGQQLLALSYEPECLTMTRLGLHFALTVLPKYAKNNAEYRLASRDWVRKAIEWGENIALVLSVVNFFRFLKTGRKPSLIDFMLGLDFISIRANHRREIGYKYLTRELVWGGFMELLGLVLPIINFQKLQRMIRKTLHGSSVHSTKGVLKAPKLDVNTMCAYCSERPTLPHHIGCGHIYCFYCIQANTLTDSRFCCTICDRECSDGVFPVSIPLEVVNVIKVDMV
ncbi:peroxisome biogenesis factor 2 [Eupeodes corollae]|uniref:peroxisome biogenesis factor 2 n=1 Tax=Eupeodes corollae TaxID=290404 RepID=UPI002492C8B7|nr:peroxisome biogenesis factor 2 [Eupeodes corollae]